MREAATGPLGSPRDKTVELIVPGERRRASLTGSAQDRSVIGAIAASGGHYEEHMMRRIQAILGPGAISLDVGANLGALSIAMAWASPGGRVHAFEAARSNHRYLEMNLEANAPAVARAEHLAMYDERTSLDISYVEEVAGCSFISPVGIREGHSEAVEAMPLDDWVADAGWPPSDRIRLIKLDVEGAERRVIEGARRTIREHRPRVLVEFNPTTATRFYGEDPRDLFDLLTRAFSLIQRIEAPGGGLVPVADYGSLIEDVERSGGWLDLECRV